MADIKLTYFNAKGRGETARLILAHAGAKYTDDRLTGPQFGALKPNLRYNQVPKLTYNNEEIYQSVTIYRFLANEFGLSGRSNLEKAQADEIVDRIQEIVTARYKAIFTPDEAAKAEAVAKFMKEAVPTALGQLERRLKERGGQFFVSEIK